MTKINRTFDVLTSEQRAVVIRELSSYCATELECEMGLIAAEDLLDFFLRIAGGAVYNRGVADARKLVHERFADVELELDLLENK